MVRTRRGSILRLQVSSGGETEEGEEQRLDDVTQAWIQRDVSVKRGVLIQRFVDGQKLQRKADHKQREDGEEPEDICHQVPDYNAPRAEQVMD